MPGHRHSLIRDANAGVTIRPALPIDGHNIGGRPKRIAARIAEDFLDVRPIEEQHNGHSAGRYLQHNGAVGAGEFCGRGASNGGCFVR